MRVITTLEDEDITITLIPETDIEAQVVRSMQNINASRMNGNLVLVKERADVRQLKEVQ